MVGHSKWWQVKHIKGLLDVKRGAASSKRVKEITVAARLGGGDLAGNPRARPVAESARAQNMLKQNTERAIKKGTDEPAGTRDDGTPHAHSHFHLCENLLTWLAA